MRPYGKTLGRGEIVREHLTSHGPATPYELWQHMVDTYKTINAEWHSSSFESFRQYFWKLKKAGLVEEDHREPIESYGGQLSGTFRSSEIIKERIFYRIVKSKYADEGWENINKTLYG
jgi:hypothetical protein